MTRRIMSAILPGAAAVLCLVHASRLSAQTVDQARVVIGISIGRIGGSDLWDVARQPILSVLEPGVPDTFRLHREVRPGLTIGVHGTLFVSPHFGLTGEFTYLGLGTGDACTLLNDDGDASLVGVCNALANQSGHGAAFALQVGGVARLSSGSAVQPYLKGLVGVASTPSSTVELIAPDADLYGSGTLVVYRDFHWNNQRPTWTVAAGLATAPSQGLQLRLELRDTWLAQSVVTGSTVTQNVEPPNRTVLKAFPSILLGFDIVLKRQRGRRY